MWTGFDVVRLGNHTFIEKLADYYGKNIPLGIHFCFFKKKFNNFIWALFFKQKIH